MGWVSPTGFVDPEAEWEDEADAYDGSIYTFAYHRPPRYWGDYLELTHAAMDCNKVRYYVSTHEYITQISVDVYYGDDWHNIYEGAFTNDEWIEKEIGTTESVTAARVKFYCLWGNGYSAYLNEFEFWEVAASTKTVDIDALLEATDTKTVALSTLLQDTDAKTVSLDTLLQVLGITRTVALDALLGALGTTRTVALDTLLKYVGVEKTADLDTLLRGTVSEAVTIDSLLQDTDAKTIALDIILERIGRKLKLNVITSQNRAVRVLTTQNRKVRAITSGG